MGTEVASRPSLPTGLSPNYQGPGQRKRVREREQSVSLRSGSAGSHARSGKAIYSRDCHLRIQTQKYSLAKSIVCIGAKIHQRFSPGINDERTRDHNVFRENTSSSKFSSSSGGGNKLCEVSFISDPTYSQSRETVVTNSNPSPRNFPNSQDYKTRYRQPDFHDVPDFQNFPCEFEFDEIVDKDLDGCHELQLRLADFDGELDESLSFPYHSPPNKGLPYITIEKHQG